MSEETESAIGDLLQHIKNRHNPDAESDLDKSTINLAIQALKQMKPAEPCEWCDGEDHEIAKAPWTYLHIKGNELSAHGDDTAFVDIKFCPNCGREV